MKKCLLVIVFLILFTGCKNTEVTGKTSIDETTTITSEDIDSCIDITKKYLNHIAKGESGFKEIEAIFYPGHFCGEKTDDFTKSKKEVEILRVSYPAKYTLDLDFKNKFYREYNTKPYKVVQLFAQYNVNNEYIELDFIFVKETESSPWLIYDSGR